MPNDTTQKQGCGEYNLSCFLIFVLFLTFLLQVQHEISLGLNTSNLPREKWDTWDPTLISEVKTNFIKFNKFWDFLLSNKLANLSTDYNLLFLSGSICGCQYFLFTQAGLHLFCQPSPWATAGVVQLVHTKIEWIFGKIEK